MAVRKILFIFAAILLVGAIVFIGVKLVKEDNSVVPASKESSSLKGGTDIAKLFLNTIKSDDPPEKVAEYLAIARRVAEEGKEINVTDCYSKPFVFKVGWGGQIVFVNAGNKVVLDFGSDRTYAVPQNGSLTIKADFREKKDIYYYACLRGDSPNIKNGGLILID